MAIAFIIAFASIVLGVLIFGGPCEGEYVERDWRVG